MYKVLVGLVALLFVSGVQAAATISWTGCGISKKAFMSEMARAYEKEKGVKVNLSGGGATKGIRHTAQGKSEVGGSCRHLVNKPEEKGIKLVPVAWDAIVAITHKNSPIDSISNKDLIKVFTGKITDWKQLGAKKGGKIKTFIRKGIESGVGMMARELVFGDADINFTGTQKFKSTGPLEKAIMKDNMAIAFDGISSAKKRDVKILKINGVAPTVENIASGKYILYRPLYLVTAKTASPKIKDFVSFVVSPKGQAVIAAQGTVTLKQGANLWGPYRKHMGQVKGKHKGVFE